MGQPLRKLTLRGFKSIEALEDLKLGSVNVLIGANGAGKSNFVDFFRMLRALADEAFQKFVNTQGGGDGLFFLGPKHTPKICAHMEFGENVYEFDLEPTAGGGIQVGAEHIWYPAGQAFKTIGSGSMESMLKARKDESGDAGDLYDSVSNWVVYHFHDTSMTAPMRREQSVRDNRQLHSDASNIAAFLLYLRDNERGHYDLIRDTIRLIAPFFDDFLLEPETRGTEEKIRLEWRQKGSNFPFQPNNLSDGTIRFICLTTALMQPCPPGTIVIDEPELGLHPFAISLLAELIQSAAGKTQVIVSTQSPTLLDYFEPADVIVVNRRDGRSTFDRLDEEHLSDWLEEYSVGELWQKNVVQGGPTHE
jgi:predicted ATPase